MVQAGRAPRPSGGVAEHHGAVPRRPPQGGARAELLAPVAQHGVQVPSRVTRTRLRVDREPGLARPGQHVLVVQVSVDQRGVGPGVRNEIAMQPDGSRDQPPGERVAGAASCSQPADQPAQRGDAGGAGTCSRSSRPPITVHALSVSIEPRSTSG